MDVVVEVLGAVCALGVLAAVGVSLAVPWVVDCVCARAMPTVDTKAHTSAASRGKLIAAE